MKKFILIRTKHGNTYYYNIPMQRLKYLHPIEAFLADNLINPNEISLDKLYSSYDKQYNSSLAFRIRLYVKSFSRKITPITLTIISTVLGLLPFLTDGPEEVFWFDFAVGTISGMLFSIIAVVFILPVYCVRGGER